MDLGELEALALSLYAELEVDPERPPNTVRLARAWSIGVERRPLVATPAALQRFAGKTTIVVRPTVAPEYLNFFVGHELGHVLLERAGYVGEDLEACCDYLGAALMLPRAAVRAAYQAEGLRAPRVLADSLMCTQTAAALRLGEVVGVPLAAVSPALVRVRGPDAFVWPDEATIRSWAARARPGLTKVKLTDQRGRVALVADEDVSDVG